MLGLLKTGVKINNYNIKSLNTIGAGAYGTIVNLEISHNKSKNYNYVAKFGKPITETERCIYERIGIIHKKLNKNYKINDGNIEIKDNDEKEDSFIVIEKLDNFNNISDNLPSINNLLLKILFQIKTYFINYNLFHIDIKSANIMFKNNNPILIDFGGVCTTHSKKKQICTDNKKCGFTPIFMNIEGMSLITENNKKSFLTRIMIYQVGLYIYNILKFHVLINNKKKRTYYEDSLSKNLFKILDVDSLFYYDINPQKYKNLNQMSSIYMIGTGMLFKKNNKSIEEVIDETINKLFIDLKDINETILNNIIGMDINKFKNLLSCMLKCGNIKLNNQFLEEYIINTFNIYSFNKNGIIDYIKYNKIFSETKKFNTVKSKIKTYIRKKTLKNRNTIKYNTKKAYTKKAKSMSLSLSSLKRLSPKKMSIKTKYRTINFSNFEKIRTILFTS